MTSKEFFAQAAQQLTENKPMVLYRKPMREKVSQFTVEGFFQEDDQLYFTEDFSETGFVFAPFQQKSKNVLIPLGKSERITVEIGAKQSSENNKNKLATDEIGKEAHLKLVSAGIKAVQQKKLEKVVLSRRLETQTNKSPLTVFKALLENYPTAFVYCWYHPKVGMWLGATPETLLATSNNRLKTMAVAGTKSVGETNGNEAPQWTSKERHEQQLVADEIKKVLENRVVQLSVAETKNYRAGSLWHLRTDFSGLVAQKNKRGNPWREIIEKLHPTAAVCGLPKEKAAQFIVAHEAYDREFYTGFLGELNMTVKSVRAANRRNQENQAYGMPTKSTNLFVNLRCMQMVAEKAYVYVGGGITEDSQPLSEWEETQNKAQTILKVL